MYTIKIICHGCNELVGTAPTLPEAFHLAEHHKNHAFARVLDAAGTEIFARYVGDGTYCRAYYFTLDADQKPQHLDRKLLWRNSRY